MLSQFEIYVSENAARGENLVSTMRNAISGLGLRRCVRGALDSKNVEWQTALLCAAGRSDRAAEAKQDFMFTPLQERAWGPGQRLEDALRALL